MSLEASVSWHEFDTSLVGLHSGGIRYALGSGSSRTDLGLNTNYKGLEWRGEGGGRLAIANGDGYDARLFVGQ